MGERARHIVAMGGGGWMMEPENPLLDDFILSLSGKDRPKVCFLPIATGDPPGLIEAFHAAFPAARAEATHLPLFDRIDAPNPADHLPACDVIYVGGGNTANMLAIWRVHGVDRALRRAWQAGVVLAGASAGAICWFAGGSTDSFGPLAPLNDGLGLLAGSFCPHYDSEPQRRPTYVGFVARGELPGGLAMDDGAAAHIVGTGLVEVVASRPTARGYRVTRDGNSAVETELPARYLGGPGPGWPTSGEK